MSCTASTSSTASTMSSAMSSTTTGTTFMHMMSAFRRTSWTSGPRGPLCSRSTPTPSTGVGGGPAGAGRGAGTKINFPEIAPSSQGHVPIGQGTSRAFRNMLKRPHPPSAGPQTTFSLISSPPARPSPREKEIGEVAPRRRPDRVPKMPPSDRAARGLSKTCPDVSIRPPGARYGIIPAFQPARGPRRAPKTNRGHISIKTTRASPKSDPIGQSGSRTFQNIFGRPNSTSRGPDAAVSRGGLGQVATWVGT